MILNEIQRNIITESSKSSKHPEVFFETFKTNKQVTARRNVLMVVMIYKGTILQKGKSLEIILSWINPKMFLRANCND